MISGMQHAVHVLSNLCLTETKTRTWDRAPLLGTEPRRVTVRGVLSAHVSVLQQK